MVSDPLSSPQPLAFKMNSFRQAFSVFRVHIQKKILSGVPIVHRGGLRLEFGQHEFGSIKTEKAATQSSGRPCCILIGVSVIDVLYKRSNVQ